jgi:hypothetical protein
MEGGVMPKHDEMDIDRAVLSLLVHDVVEQQLEETLNTPMTPELSARLCSAMKQAFQDRLLSGPGASDAIH